MPYSHGELSTAIPAKGFECHAGGCIREREGYSLWCIAHKDNLAGRGVLDPCRCHGRVAPGTYKSYAYGHK